MYREGLSKIQSAWSGPSRLVSIAALALLCIANGFASTSSCATATTLSSLGSTTTDGCYQIDKSFTNLNVTGGITTAGTDIALSNTWTANTTPWTVTANYTNAGAAWSASGSGSLTASIFGIVDATCAYISCADSPNPGNVFNITRVQLAADAGTTTGNKSGDSITITETFCLGTGSCTGANEVTLTATYSGASVTTPTYACAAGGSVAYGTCVSAISNTFNFNQKVGTLNVVDSFTLVNASGSPTSLSGIQNIFGENEISTIPEPASFILFGSALLGVGMLRIRKGRS